MSWTRKFRRPIHRGCRLSFENLESRELLSSVPSVLPPIPVAVPAASSTPRPAGDSGNPVDNLIGASATRALYNVDGTGLTAAVIDTGVNYNHEALGSGFGPGHKVVAGADLADNTSDPLATTIQHGTAVAGILASSDPAHPGVAPGADIAALKVIGSSGKGDFSTIADGLQWVIDHHSQYNISVVNLSISDGQNYSMDWYSNDGGIGERIAGLEQQLAALNIPVVTATGNSFNGQQGEGFTAILPESFSVTATDPTDHYLPDAQRLGKALGGTSATDMAAPGSGIVAPADGNSFTGVSGTSFAAPMLSGAVILLQSIYEQRFHQLPTVSQVEGWLETGSDPVQDPVTSITIGRLDILKAASLIPSGPSDGSGSTGGSGGGGSNNTGGSGGITVGNGSGGSSNNTGGNGGSSSSSGSSSNNTPPHLVDMILNGQANGQIDESSDANPFKDFSALFGIPVTLNKVQTWTSPNIPSPTNPTALYVNGQYLGNIGSDSTANPLNGFPSAFGNDGTFNRVDIWTSPNPGSGPAGQLTSNAPKTVPQGTPTPAGRLVTVGGHATPKFTHGPHPHAIGRFVKVPHHR
jgi:subtilisin family serine protease